MSTLADSYERAVNVLTQEAAGDKASAERFVEWLGRYSVTRQEWDVAWEEELDARWDYDGWETAYGVGRQRTLIKEQCGDCYIVPVAAEGEMPEVEGGQMVADEDEGDGA